MTSSPNGADVQLPEVVADLVNGRDLERKIGPTVSLMATGLDLWPRLALLSVGEVLSESGSDLRLALYGGSRTTAALAQSGQALLNVVLEGTNYKIYAEVERVEAGAGPLSYFLGHVTEVDEDRVGYAEITSTLTFELTDRQRVLERWTQQVEHLRTLAR